MNKIREWGFPVGMIIAWLATSSYTLSQLAGAARFAASRPASAQVETARSNL